MNPWALPALFTVGWLIFVVTGGHVGRVSDNWRASATMLVGSFVSGSTPQGGGAVAFPVFTKVLDTPAPVARTFSLSIQAVGMVSASISILLAGRKIDRKALSLGVVGGVAGFLIGLFALGDPSTPFWAPRVDPAFVKVAFTLITFAVALIVRKCLGRTARHDAVDEWGPRSVSVMLAFSMIGGVFSALVGSGANVMLFVFVVLIADVSPRVAIPTSILTMASVSVLGLAVLGVADGQLSIGLDGSDVVSVAGEPFGPEAASRFDVYGLWLAAAPIVVWGAPLGAWVTSKLDERAIVRFVGAMALLEVATTALFLEPLRTDRTLLAFAIGGLAFAWFAVNRLDRLSAWIMTD